MNSDHRPRRSPATTTTRRCRRQHVVVAVLGDVGRSPRMQYHALSLLESGRDVSLVGYRGEQLVPPLQEYCCRDGGGGDERGENAAAAADDDDEDGGGTTTNKPTLNVVRFRVPSCPGAIRKIKPAYFVWRIACMCLWLSYALVVDVYYYRRSCRRRRKRRRTEEEGASTAEDGGDEDDDDDSRCVDCVLVQNPPALPLLAVAYGFCLFCGAMDRRRRNARGSTATGSCRPGLVVDWHNLGYTMLPEGSSFRRWAEKYERAAAPYADGHLTVTAAMKEYVEKHFLPDAANNNIRILYDCPPSLFQPLSIERQHDVLSKLDAKLREGVPRSWTSSESSDDSQSQRTLFTERFVDRNGAVSYRPRLDRPALVLSSTSWTPDEDFGLLLDALVALDERIAVEAKVNDDNSSSSGNLRVAVVVTGKGPDKQHYEQKMSQLALRNVAVQTMWLEPGDYPKLLACADVGVCLHTSTSGLDLPMKVLDLFGCRVPVCAVNFPCLDELVQDGVNGRVFETSHQLADQLWELLSPLASSALDQRHPCHSFGALDEYSRALQHRTRWSENWTDNALHVIVAASAAAGATPPVAAAKTE